VVFGTDLLGHMHGRQSGEFAIRAAVQPAVEVLQAATIVAARLMGREREIGQLVAGAWADLLVVDGDPTVDLTPLAEPAQGIRLLMQGGRIVCRH
jgi:imidazolonepropionase-like amidohydrolase